MIAIVLSFFTLYVERIGVMYKTQIDSKSIFEQTVYSTEELTGLMEAIEREGGQVLHTYGKRGESGIAVQYDLLNNK